MFGLLLNVLKYGSFRGSSILTDIRNIAAIDRHRKSISKLLGGSPLKSVVNATLKHSQQHGLGALYMHAGFIGLIMLGNQPAQEKLHAIIGQTAMFWLTMGMGGARQMLWQSAFMISGALPSVARGLVSGYKSSIESRTSLAVPFSHSSMAMDQAFAGLQYAQNRLQGAYTSIGGEASFMAARYLQR